MSREVQFIAWHYAIRNFINCHVKKLTLCHELFWKSSQ
jgi:hypothetical protein